MRVLLLIIIFVYVFSFAELRREPSGVVIDDISGLMWQDDYADNGNIKESDWIRAIEYCENLTLGNYNDWRLPNIRELGSIVDYAKYDPAINEVFQNMAQGDYYGIKYWTSTTSQSYTSQAWYVDFKNGIRNEYSKSTKLHVRCVRSGQ
jgi:hypothetical protein